MILQNSTKILIVIVFVLGCSSPRNTFLQTGVFLPPPNHALIPSEKLNGRLEFNVVPVNDTIAFGDSLRLELSYLNLSADSLFLFIVSPDILLEPKSTWTGSRIYLDTLPDGEILKWHVFNLRTMPITYIDANNYQDMQNKRKAWDYRKFGAFDSIKTIIAMDIPPEYKSEREFKVTNPLPGMFYYDTIQNPLANFVIHKDTLYSKSFTVLFLEE